MSDVESIVRMVGSSLPGLREVDAVDWVDVETNLGFAIPRDYKELIDSVGAGVIDDSLCIYGSDPDDRDGNFLELVRLCDESWDAYRAAGATLPERYFVNVRLIPFGSAEGNYFYWRATEGVPSDRWGVLMVDADLQNWYEFDSTATNFMRRLMSGEVQPPTLSGLFGSNHHKIERFGDVSVDGAE